MTTNTPVPERGSHPYTDWKFHHAHPFAPQIERLLADINETEPEWLEQCPEPEQALWDARFLNWSEKLDLVDGIERLTTKLRQLQDAQLAEQLKHPPEIPDQSELQPPDAQGT
jgi:hypothetical protein